MTATVKPKVETKKEIPKTENKVYAVIRVRGGFMLRSDMRITMDHLHLTRQNHLVLVKDSPVNNGMIRKINSYVTWGDIDEETLIKLLIKRGKNDKAKDAGLDEKKAKEISKEVVSGKKSLNDFGLKNLFRLSPPTNGWERGTIKVLYPRGALGFRGKEINKLIKRMM